MFAHASCQHVSLPEAEWTRLTKDKLVIKDEEIIIRKGKRIVVQLVPVGTINFTLFQIFTCHLSCYGVCLVDGGLHQ